MGLVLVFPIWEKTAEEQDRRVTIDAFYLSLYEKAPDDQQWQASAQHPVFYIAIAAALSCILALYTIFQYTNRMKQIKLGALNAFLMMASVGIAAYFIYEYQAQVPGADQGQFELGIFLPVIALIMNSLANRFIRRDENLVRSVDRLR
jgi:hypothetical protein